MEPIKWKGNKPTDFSFLGLIITLGIVYGDLGTSPLYTMSAILKYAGPVPREGFVLGALSLVFWTLTLQTTFKYIFVTLRANNKGEGGIFLLFTLLKERRRWASAVAVVGACALLGDGIITPAVTVTSAVEGLTGYFPHLKVDLIVVMILSVLFFSQQFGSSSLGKYFGPVMALWFLMLALFGVRGVIFHPDVFKAVHPLYALEMIQTYPQILGLLGAVFLCTTGAEALFSDLGHCGLKNIRVTWVYVKISLVLSYFGQGAWVLAQGNGWNGENPFFAFMPGWFLPFGIALATLAAIIASQALITGAFTIVSEAISLKLFPPVDIKYPSTIKGQMYIPYVNKVLWVGCIFVVLFFKSSSAMEAAYGLSITVAMLMTTVLLTNYTAQKQSWRVALPMGALFLTVELSFLAANLTKFSEGGWVSLLLCVGFAAMMYVWQTGGLSERKFTSYVSLEEYYSIFSNLRNDSTVPYYASHLVYLTRSTEPQRVEKQLLYSLFRNNPKRANTYWLLYITVRDTPRKLNYKVTPLIPGVLNRVDMYIGFKMPMKANLYFQQILIEMARKGETGLVSNYESLHKHNVMSDIRFVIINRIHNLDYDFGLFKTMSLDLYFGMKRYMVDMIRSFGFDSTRTGVEDVPLMSSGQLFYDTKTIAQIESTSPQIERFK